MKSIAFMDSEVVRKNLTMDRTIGWMEEVYRLYARGEADVFPIITHEFEEGLRNTDIKSGHLDGAGCFGLKVLTRVMDNPEKRGLPPLTGLVLVIDSQTGQPMGLLDGLSITNMRTGAAGGLGAKTFARKDSKNAVIVGAGYQGGVQLLGLTRVLPTLGKVTIVDQFEEKAKSLVEELKPRHDGLSLKSATPEVLPDLLAEADVLVTCTPSKSAFIHREWIRPGTHINAIGADMPGKQELDPDLVASARLFADSRKQVTRLGECQHAFAEGFIGEEDVTEIGHVLEGRSPGRVSDDEITIFDATGMAIQDLIVGARLLEGFSETTS